MHTAITTAQEKAAAVINITLAHLLTMQRFATVRTFLALKSHCTRSSGRFSTIRSAHIH
jgi:hypothetical protein